MMTNIFATLGKLFQWAYLHILQRDCPWWQGSILQPVTERVWPAWPFTHPTACSAQLLWARKVRRDTIATLIDWVNKYPVSVPVRCTNTLSVCFHPQRITVTSCLPCFCELMKDRGLQSLGETGRNHVWEGVQSCITCTIFFSKMLKD